MNHQQPGEQPSRPAGRHLGKTGPTALTTHTIKRLQHTHLSHFYHHNTFTPHVFYLPITPPARMVILWFFNAFETFQKTHFWIFVFLFLLLPVSCPVTPHLLAYVLLQFL